MNSKYFLYIDILGFKDLVPLGQKRVHELYQLINALNVHDHYAFSVLVFSDTILVYNKTDPINDHDHSCIVMYAIEFVKDLLYRLIGKDIFFRATLRYDEFNHFKLSNLNAFYGPALIEAHRDEKINTGTGLLLHKTVWARNDIFKTVYFSDEYCFVFLNQTLDTVLGQYGPNVPFSVSGTDFENQDFPLDIAKDVIFLKSIYQNMLEHPDPQVRTKFLTTWQMYRTRFGAILDALEKSSFNPKVLVPSLDWSKYINQAIEK
ncbi:MAG: hypothetical protein Q7R35_12505 [Elusimicrobiota bacterium]|nr:hypothetical protein [Elusimicrobiota bacterium]